jgi:hypothetical protein
LTGLIATSGVQAVEYIVASASRRIDIINALGEAFLGESMTPLIEACFASSIQILCRIGSGADGVLHEVKYSYGRTDGCLASSNYFIHCRLKDVNWAWDPAAQET